MKADRSRDDNKNDSPSEGQGKSPENNFHAPPRFCEECQFIEYSCHDNRRLKRPCSTRSRTGQRLKPHRHWRPNGTAEAVPYKDSENTTFAMMPVPLGLRHGLLAVQPAHLL